MASSIHLDANPPRVDIVLLTLKDDELHVALIRRERQPYEGCWALPGGFVHEEEDDTILDAATRVLKQKAGVEGAYLEELCTFSGRTRDPRRWSLTVAHFAVVPFAAFEGHSLPDMRLEPVKGLRGLAFDHKDIVNAAVERVRSKSSYSSLPVYLCGDEFTIPELMSVYEAVVGTDIDKASFRRKLKEMDILEEAPVKRGASEENRPGGRPPKRFRLRKQFRHALSVRDRGIVSA